MDLDGPPASRQQTLADRELAEYAEDTFFMIQKMEAWILSQPHVIEDRFGNEKQYTITQNELPTWHDYQLIVHPDEVLDTAIQRRYRDPLHKTRNGDHKKAKYGKLKDAPGMIAALNLEQLAQDFSDVAALIAKIRR
jgi:hypothetical protein